jgi:hypothetical protein
VVAERVLGLPADIRADKALACWVRVSVQFHEFTHVGIEDRRPAATKTKGSIHERRLGLKLG